MIPVGYLAKNVIPKPDWLTNDSVIDIYSVSGCVARDFADYITLWKHNGFWLFDSPQIICQLAIDHGIDLANTTMFFYEEFELQFCPEYAEHRSWTSFEPDRSFETHIVVPAQKAFHGFDVVTFLARNKPECSPLSCNNLAGSIMVNSHCLIDSFDDAKRLIETGAFERGEPGPHRIMAVYSVEASA